MNTTRTERKDIRALWSAKRVYGLSEGQWFCETNKAYEVWGMYNGLERRIARIPKRAIYWVCQY